MLRIHLSRSKCDQFGKGVDVFVGKSGNELCYIEAISAYTAKRGDAPGPFFCDKNGSPQDKYAGQSFRIGAVTAIAQAGLEDSTIRALVVCMYMCATIRVCVHWSIILLWGCFSKTFGLTNFGQELSPILPVGVGAPPCKTLPTELFRVLLSRVSTMPRHQPKVR